MRRFFLTLSVLSFVFVAVGCGGAEGDTERVETYETTGTITYNGKPLADAVVSFSPKDTQPPALGRTDSSGSYSLRTYEDGDGAAAGKYTVLVTKETVSSASQQPAPHDPSGGGGGPAAHSANASEPKSEIPQKYNSQATSDLTATVTEDGDNEFNFDLKD